MHLKSTAGCQISSLIFGIRETLYSIIPPRHINHLKTRAILLISTPSGKELSVLRHFFKAYV
jgi:hypothetical protein